jgi:signal peptidase I
VSVATALSPYPIERGPRRNPSTPVPPASVADKIRVGGSAIIRVLARTMYPWVRPGDQVFVRRFDFSQVVAGDIILYQRANRLFIHRVTRRIIRPNLEGKASFLVVQGDAANRSDAPVSNSEFLGRAIRIHRGKRHIDLESLSQTVLGRILAKVSRGTRFLHRPLQNPSVSNIE